MAEGATEPPESRLSIDKLIARAAEQGLPPPTVETLIRAFTHHRPSLNRPYMSKDPLMTAAVSSGGGEGICILGITHLPSLGSILAGVGLEHMLADLATPASTRLDELDDKVRHLLDWRVQEDARPWNNTLDPFMRNLCYLWRKFRYTDDSHDKLYFAAWEERGVTRLSWSRDGNYEPGIFATPEGRDCGRAITQLEGLVPYISRSCCRSTIHPDALPHVQASDAGCVFGKLTSSSADQPYNVYLLFGETDFMPLFLLPIDSDSTLAYRLPECRVRDNSATFISLTHVGLTDLQILETLASLFPTKPDNPPSESRLAKRKSAILLYGKRTPYDASLALHGTSLPHLLFSAIDAGTKAKAEQQVLARVLEQMQETEATDIGAAMSELSHLPPSPPPEDYRLATFTDLQKCKMLSAAFVDRDGRLAAIHDLSPLCRPSAEADAASSFPTPPATPSSSASNGTATGLDKPLLLVSSETLGFGHQGVVHRAYCADSPFPLVVKYSCEPEWERHDTFELLCDEIAFYQAHGADLAAEGIAPRFVGGWTTVGESSPRMCGTRTAVLVLEEWGEAMKETEDQTFEDLDKDGRVAVFRLAQRLHSKLGVQHGSLYPRNFLWKPSLGYSSIRLIDWARGEVHEGGCCLDEAWLDDDEAEEGVEGTKDTGTDREREERAAGTEEEAEERKLCYELKALWRRLAFEEDRESGQL